MEKQAKCGFPAWEGGGHVPRIPAGAFSGGVGGRRAGENRSSEGE